VDLRASPNDRRAEGGEIGEEIRTTTAPILVTRMVIRMMIRMTSPTMSMILVLTIHSHRVLWKITSGIGNMPNMPVSHRALMKATSPALLIGEAMSGRDDLTIPIHTSSRSWTVALMTISACPVLGGRDGMAGRGTILLRPGALATKAMRPAASRADVAAGGATGTASRSRGRADFVF
jgi:hypothetical protein